MKKAIVICILVAVFACMCASVSYASIGKYPNVPADAYSDEFKQNFIIVKSKSIAETSPCGTILFVVQNPVGKHPNGIITEYKAMFYTQWNGTSWGGANYFQEGTTYANVDTSFWTKYDVVYTTVPIYTNGTFTTVDTPANYVLRPFGDADVVITSPIDLYQDNSKRWKLRSVLAINDVEGGFDTSKLSYVLEFYAGPLYAQAELVSVTYSEIQDELYILTEEDRVVNMKTFEFEPPASRGKARVICLYDDEVIATAEVRYHRYSGFVDEDGDDLDDRTGLPDHSNESDYELIVEIPQKPEDGDLLAWIQYIAELFGYVIEMAISVLKDFAEGVVDGLRVILEIAEPMFSFVEQFFASLPAPMSGAIIALVTVSAVLGILKLLRG